jgi:high-affinity iron transporter
MGAALLITLREGIEAALVISILLASLKQMGRSDAVRLVWLGSVAAVGGSVLVAAVLFKAGADFEGRAEQLFEGLVSLIAVAILTTMIFYMRRMGGRLRTELSGRVGNALATGGLSLAVLSFATVGKEGVETALFVFAAARGTAVGTGDTNQLIGALLGLSIASALGAGLYLGAVRLNLRTFFRWTSLLILVVAAGLLAFSIRELQEAGALPFLRSTLFDLSGTLPDDRGFGAILRALFGYQSAPTTLSSICWIAYLAITGTLWARPRTRSGASIPEPSV